MWVTTHSKQEVSDNTLKKKMSTTAQEMWALQLKKGEHYSSRNRLQEDHGGSSWENREKLDWV
jgi:hypothetical protein